MTNPNNADFEQWETEVQDPYGADLLIHLTPQGAAGALACMNGLDVKNQPCDTGSGGVDDANAEYIEPADDDVHALA